MVSDVRTTLDRTSLRGAITDRAIASLRKANALVAEMRLKAYMFRPNGSDTFGPVSSVPGHLRRACVRDQDTINCVFAADADQGKTVLAFGTMLDMPTLDTPGPDKPGRPDRPASSACVAQASRSSLGSCWPP